MRSPALLPDALPVPRPSRAASRVGVGAAVAAALLYAAGWDRAFSFDASRTALAWLAAGGVAANLVVMAPDLTRDEVPNRTAAPLVAGAQAAGRDVCALGRTRAGLLAYASDVRVLWNPLELPTCFVAVEAAGPRVQPLLEPACRRFAYVRVLPAKHPGAVFADRPLDADPSWQRTAGAAVCGR